MFADHVREGSLLWDNDDPDSRWMVVTVVGTDWCDVFCDCGVEIRVYEFEFQQRLVDVVIY